MTTDRIPEDRKMVPAVAGRLDQPVGRPVPERLAEAGLTEDDLDGLPAEVLAELRLDKKRRGPGVAAKTVRVPKPKVRAGSLMVLTRSAPWIGNSPPKVERILVRVMVHAEGYAMVRRKGCMPFVCSESDLTPNASLSGGRQ